MRSLFVHVETDGSHRVFETMGDLVVVVLLVDSFADAGDATIVETVDEATKPNSRLLRRVLSS